MEKKKVLILTLGTGLYEKNPDEKGRKVSTYIPTDYMINDRLYAETRYVATPLISEYKPDEIIILGTITSGWSGLLAAFSNLEMIKDLDTLLKDNDFKYLYELENTRGYGKDTPVDTLKTEQAIITKIYRRRFLMEDVEKKPIVHTLLLRYGIADDQLRDNYDLMSGIESILGSGSCDIAFDITHSFRSLPLYNLSVIKYLNSCRNEHIDISHVYYGNLEVSRENNKTAPVVDLIDLVHVLDMSSAVDEFANTGNVISLVGCLNESETDLKMSLERFDLAIQFNSFNDIDNSLKELLDECIVSYEEPDSSRIETRYVQLRDMIREVLRRKMFGTQDERNLNEIYSEMSIHDKRVMICKWCANQRRFGQGLANCMELFRSIITPVYVQVKNITAVDTESDEQRRRDAENYVRSKGKAFQRFDQLSVIQQRILDVTQLIEKYKEVRNIFAHTLICDNDDLMNIDGGVLEDFIGKLIALKETIDVRNNDVVECLKEHTNSIQVTDQSTRVRLIVGIGNCRINYQEYMHSSSRTYEVYIPDAAFLSKVASESKNYLKGFYIAKYWSSHFDGLKGEIVIFNADSDIGRSCALALRKLGSCISNEVNVLVYDGIRKTVTIKGFELTDSEYESFMMSSESNSIFSRSAIHIQNDNQAKGVFVNVSDFPSSAWESAQRDEVDRMGCDTVEDIPFPYVDQDMKEQALNNLANDYVERVLQKIPPLGHGVAFIHGDFSLSYKVMKELKARGIKIVCGNYSGFGKLREV